MTNIIQKVEDGLRRAKQIVGDQLPVKEQVAKFNDDADRLLTQVHESAQLKIPFVGGFNAGKSEILNTIIGRRILPTAILPETAVAYEIYYSQAEKVDLFTADGKLKQTVGIDGIKNLSTTPGDVARIYVNSPVIKDLNDRGIALVDMPGVNSGIEAHDKAINNYIGNAAAFFYFVDVQFGTLSLADLGFIKEFKQYGTDLRVFVSKVDTKPAEEVESVRKNIEGQVRGFGSSDASVGVTSAVDEQLGARDVIAALSGIDVEQMRRQMFVGYFVSLIDGAAGQFDMQANLAKAEGRDFSADIARLQDQKENILASLESKRDGSQDAGSSAEDIVRDVREALENNAHSIAFQVVNSGNGGDAVGNAILSVIKPVMLSSFNREMTEYGNDLTDCVKEAIESVNAALSSNMSETGQLVVSLIDKAGGFDVASVAIKGFMAKMAARYAGKVLGGALTFLNPVVGIVVMFLPEILSWLFSDSKEKKTMKVEQKLLSEVFPNVCEKLRPEIVKVVEDGRRQAYESMKAEVDTQVAKIDDNIRAAQQSQAASEAERDAKVATFTKAKEDLVALKEQI